MRMLHARVEASRGGEPLIQSLNSSIGELCLANFCALTTVATAVDRELASARNHAA